MLCEARQRRVGARARVGRGWKVRDPLMVLHLARGSSLNGAGATAISHRLGPSSQPG